MEPFQQGKDSATEFPDFSETSRVNAVQRSSSARSRQYTMNPAGYPILQGNAQNMNPATFLLSQARGQNLNATGYPARRFHEQNLNPAGYSIPQNYDETLNPTRHHAPHPFEQTLNPAGYSIPQFYDETLNPTRHHVPPLYEQTLNPAGYSIPQNYDEALNPTRHHVPHLYEQTLNPTGHLVSQYHQQMGTEVSQYRSHIHEIRRQQQMPSIPDVTSQRNPYNIFNPAGYTVRSASQYQINTAASRQQNLAPANFQQTQWLPDVILQNDPRHEPGQAEHIMNFAPPQQTMISAAQNQNIVHHSNLPHQMPQLPMIPPYHDPQDGFGLIEPAMNLAPPPQSISAAPQSIQSYAGHQISQHANMATQNRPQQSSRTKMKMTDFAILTPERQAAILQTLSLEVQQQVVKALPPQEKVSFIRHIYQQSIRRQLHHQQQTTGSQIATPAYTHPSAVSSLGHPYPHEASTAKNPNQVQVQASVKAPGPVASNTAPSDHQLQTSNPQSYAAAPVHVKQSLNRAAEIVNAQRQGAVPPVPRSLNGTHEILKAQRLGTVPSLAQPPHGPLETNFPQPQATVSTVARSPKRPLETDSQSQEAPESSPSPAKKQCTQRNPIIEIVDDPVPVPAPQKAPLTAEQIAANKFFQRMAKRPPAWLEDYQMRSDKDGKTFHVEERDLDTKLRIEAQDVIDSDDMLWLEKYEERQRKIEVVREQMQKERHENPEDPPPTDREVWNRYYNPPQETIFDPNVQALLQAQDAAARRAAKINTKVPKHGSKAALALRKKQEEDEERARKQEEKEREKAEKKQKADEKKAAAAALKFREAERKFAERHAKKKAQKEAKQQERATKLTQSTKKSSTTKAAKITEPTKKATTPTHSRTISSSSIDSLPFTSSSAESVATRATTPGDLDDIFEGGDWTPLVGPEPKAPVEDEEEEEDWLGNELEQDLEEGVGQVEEAPIEESRYNEEGFDEFGFDREGYGRNGYNKKGLDRSGRDPAGNDWDSDWSEAED